MTKSHVLVSSHGKKDHLLPYLARYKLGFQLVQCQHLNEYMLVIIMMRSPNTMYYVYIDRHSDIADAGKLFWLVECKSFVLASLVKSLAKARSILSMFTVHERVQYMKRGTGMLLPLGLQDMTATLGARCAAVEIGPV